MLEPSCNSFRLVVPDAVVLSLVLFMSIATIVLRLLGLIVSGTSTSTDEPCLLTVIRPRG